MGRLKMYFQLNMGIFQPAIVSLPDGNYHFCYQVTSEECFGSTASQIGASSEEMIPPDLQCFCSGRERVPFPANFNQIFFFVINREISMLFSHEIGE